MIFPGLNEQNSNWPARVNLYALKKTCDVKTRSFTVNNANDIRAEIDVRLKDGFAPNLAFVFASARQGIHEISKALKVYDIDIVGSSSGGNILAQNSGNVIFEESIVITLLEIDKSCYAYMMKEQQDLSDMALGNEIGQWALGQFDHPHIIVIGSGMGMNGQELVEGILETAGMDTNLFGGIAGDDIRFEKNYIFNGQKVVENGALVLAFDPGMIDLHGLSTSGWVGLGKDLTITAAESNIVYSIDNQPALEVYKSYLSVQDTDLPAIGVEYPLLIKRDDDTYALRAVMGVDRKHKSLIFSGTVPEEAIVSFSSSPGFEVIERTKENIEAFHREHPEADLLLLFSCMARHLALGPVITEEITFAREKWNLPVTGFFTYGEIGTNSGKVCDFYNQTYSLVIFKEK